MNQFDQTYHYDPDRARSGSDVHVHCAHLRHALRILLCLPSHFVELYNYNDGMVGLMFIPILIGAGSALVAIPFIKKHFKQICHL